MQQRREDTDAGFYDEEADEMIRISDKAMCCGCSACVNACPVQCIVPRRDREGFYYPVANSDLCIECGKCEEVCPVLNPLEKRQSLESYAARSHKAAPKSSSGGVFTLAAEKFIDEGGVVYGAAFAPDMSVEHIEVCDKDTLVRLRGSKYVQSELFSAYEEVRDRLREGRKVMFCGTPCQVAGLRKYLGKDTKGLLTMDFACHGVPSPGLWEKYVKALQEKEGFRLTDVNFRDSSRSWRHYDVVYEGAAADGQKCRRSVEASRDTYLALFRQDLSLRPSCYRCPARDGRSGSDLTLADLWSVPQSAPTMNDDRGVSLVLVNSEEGKACFESLQGIESLKVDCATARSDNGGFAAEVRMPQRRSEFFKGVHSAQDLLGYMEGFVVKKTVFERIYRTLRSAAVRIKRRISG